MDIAVEHAACQSKLVPSRPLPALRGMDDEEVAAVTRAALRSALENIGYVNSPMSPLTPGGAGNSSRPSFDQSNAQLAPVVEAPTFVKPIVDQWRGITQSGRSSPVRPRAAAGATAVTTGLRFLRSLKEEALRTAAKEADMNSQWHRHKTVLPHVLSFLGSNEVRHVLSRVGRLMRGAALESVGRSLRVLGGRPLHGKLYLPMSFDGVIRLVPEYAAIYRMQDAFVVDLPKLSSHFIADTLIEPGGIVTGTVHGRVCERLVSMRVEPGASDHGCTMLNGTFILRGLTHQRAKDADATADAAFQNDLDQFNAKSSELLATEAFLRGIGGVTEMHDGTMIVSPINETSGTAFALVLSVVEASISRTTATGVTFSIAARGLEEGKVHVPPVTEMSGTKPPKQVVYSEVTIAMSRGPFQPISTLTAEFVAPVTLTHPAVLTSPTDHGAPSRRPPRAERVLGKIATRYIALAQLATLRASLYRRPTSVVPRLSVFVDGWAAPLAVLSGVPCNVTMADLRRRINEALPSARVPTTFAFRCYRGDHRTQTLSEVAVLQSALLPAASFASVTGAMSFTDQPPAASPASGRGQQQHHLPPLRQQDSFSSSLNVGPLSSFRAKVSTATRRQSNTSRAGDHSSSSHAASLRQRHFAAPVAADEEAVKLHQCLPPNRGQFLCVKSLTLGEYCGWPAGTLVHNDRTLAIVLTVAEEAAPHQAASAASSPAASFAAASTLPAALHHLVLQYSAAYDACAAGDAQRVAQCLETAVLASNTPVTNDAAPSGSSSPMSNRASPLSFSFHIAKAKGVPGTPSAGSTPALAAQPQTTVVTGGISVRASGVVNTPLLHVACEYGHVEVVETLLLRGASALQRDAGGLLPLHVAARRGHAACIPPLVKAAASAINATDRRGRTALHHALYAGFTNTALWLVEHGADPLTTDDDGFAPVALACKRFDSVSDAAAKDDVARVRILLKIAMGLTMPRDARTAEMSAKHASNFDGAKSLLDHKDDSLQDWYVELLRHKLTRGRLLLDLFGTVTISPIDGQVIANVTGHSALHMAVEHAAYAAVAALLQCPLVDVNAKNANGDTPLHRATAKGDLRMIELLSRRSDIDGTALNDLGETPLHSALARGNVSCVETLLTRFAGDPLLTRRRNKLGFSACHNAVLLGDANISTLQLVLSHALHGYESQLGELRKSDTGVADPLDVSFGDATEPSGVQEIDDAKAAAVQERACEAATLREAYAAPSSLQVTFQTRFPSKARFASVTKGAAPGDGSAAGLYRSISQRGKVPTLIECALSTSSAEMISFLYAARKRNTPRGRWPESEFGSFHDGLLLHAYHHRSIAVMKVLTDVVKLNPRSVEVKFRGLPIALPAYVLLTALSDDWIDFALSGSWVKMIQPVVFADDDTLRFIEASEEPTDESTGSGAAQTHTRCVWEPTNIFVLLVREYNVAVTRETRMKNKQLASTSQVHLSSRKSSTDKSRLSTPNATTPPTGPASPNNFLSPTITVTPGKALQPISPMKSARTPSDCTTAPSHSAIRRRTVNASNYSVVGSAWILNVIQRTLDAFVANGAHPVILSRAVLFALLTGDGSKHISNVFVPYLNPAMSPFTHSPDDGSRATSPTARKLSSDTNVTEVAEMALAARRGARSPSLPFVPAHRHKLALDSFLAATATPTGVPTSKIRTNLEAAIQSRHVGGAASKRGRKPTSAVTPATPASHAQQRRATKASPMRSGATGAPSVYDAAMRSVTPCDSVPPEDESMRHANREAALTLAVRATLITTLPGRLLHLLCGSFNGSAALALLQSPVAIVIAQRARALKSPCASAVASQSFGIARSVNFDDEGASRESWRDQDQEQLTGRDALQFAVELPDNTELITALLATGDFEPVQAGRNVDGYSAIHYAAQTTNPAALRQLLGRGGTRYARTLSRQTQMTALHAAALAGRVEQVQMLLDTVGSSHRAVWKPHQQPHEYVDLRDSRGRTALLLACRNGHDAVATLLMEHGADLNVVDTRGDTPLVAAARAGRESLLLRVVQRHGASVLVVANQASGTSVLHHAAWRGMTKIVELFVGHATGAAASSANASTMSASRRTLLPPDTPADGAVGSVNLQPHVGGAKRTDDVSAATVPDKEYHLLSVAGQPKLSALVASASAGSPFDLSRTAPHLAAALGIAEATDAAARPSPAGSVGGRGAPMHPLHFAAGLLLGVSRSNGSLRHHSAVSLARSPEHRPAAHRRRCWHACPRAGCRRGTDGPGTRRGIPKRRFDWSSHARRCANRNAAGRIHATPCSQHRRTPARPARPRCVPQPRLAREAARRRLRDPAPGGHGGSRHHVAGARSKRFVARDALTRGPLLLRRPRVAAAALRSGQRQRRVRRAVAHRQS
jgi:ankyrin repeat protein